MSKANKLRLCAILLSLVIWLTGALLDQTGDAKTARWLVYLMLAGFVMAVVLIVWAEWADRL